MKAWIFCRKFELVLVGSASAQAQNCLGKRYKTDGAKRTSYLRVRVQGVESTSSTIDVTSLYASGMNKKANEACWLHLRLLLQWL